MRVILCNIELVYTESLLLKIIKLNAVDSTNSFLKEMTQNYSVENFTTVVAEAQYEGRGQANKKWFSEPCKNLIFSTFVSFSNFFIRDQKYLNFAVALAVFKTLNAYQIPLLKIKWPNDILSANKKLCGILTENTIQKDKITSSIIGIGINVNQEEFPKEIPMASSIKKITGKKMDLENLLQELLENLKKYLNLLVNDKFKMLENQYLEVLYKKDIPAMFKDAEDKLFMGIVKGIATNGNLQVELENSCIQEFGLKEIKFM